MYSGPIDTALRLVAVVVGVGFLAQAGLVLRQSILMTAPDTSRIRDVTSGDTVAIEGIVQAKQNKSEGVRTITAPLSGEECVFAAWKVEEFFGHELGAHSDWSKQASGYDTTMFELSDAGDTILVKVSGEWEFLSTEFDLEGLDSPQQTVSIEETPPPEVQAFEKAEEIRERTPAVVDVPTTESGPHQGDRRYFEATIAPGDSVFVSGVASEVEGETDLVVSDSSNHRLFISDEGQESATKDRLFGVVVLSVVGVFLLWYAVAPLL